MGLNIKAITIGGLSIIIGVLLLQLVYLFASVAFHALGKHLAFEFELGETGSLLTAYAFWGLSYWLIMYYGGVITASYAEEAPWQNSLATGVITNLLVMMMVPQESSYNVGALLFFIISVVICFLGGYRTMTASSGERV